MYGNNTVHRIHFFTQPASGAEIDMIFKHFFISEVDMILSIFIPDLFAVSATKVPEELVNH